jgi:DNA-binding XRE family transcriptional regulator
MSEDKALSRFLSYLEKKEDGCWVWKGGKDIKGYGIFWYKGKAQFAHRVSLLLHNKVKEFNPDMQILHSCRETGCVNPDHLSEGTRKQNSADKHRDGTALVGEKCHFSKLTWEKVRDIRKKFNTSRKALAEEYSVSPTTIGLIINRKSWIEKEDGIEP